MSDKTIAAKGHQNKMNKTFKPTAILTLSALLMLACNDEKSPSSRAADANSAARKNLQNAKDKTVEATKSLAANRIAFAEERVAFERKATAQIEALKVRQEALAKVEDGKEAAARDAGKIRNERVKNALAVTEDKLELLKKTSEDSWKVAMQDFDKAYRNTSDKLESWKDRQDFEKKISINLNKMDARLDTIKSELADAKDGAKDKLNKEWDELSPKRDEVREKYNEFSNSADEKWDEAKEGLEKTFKELSKTFKNLFS